MNTYYCETHQVGGTVRCHVCQAVNAERERIIKLLETDPIVNYKDYSDEDVWAFEKAIALIKGENK